MSCEKDYKYERIAHMLCEKDNITRKPSIKVLNLNDVMHARGSQPCRVAFPA